MEYDFISDLALAKKMLGMTDLEFSKFIGVSRSTYNRWLAGEAVISRTNLEKAYAAIYRRGINVNKIKAEFYIEDYSSENKVILFHGAKKGIDGEISLFKAKANNDFGRGFYCGESLVQSAMFSANYPDSSIYIFSFNKAGLKKASFLVDSEWMLAIAYYRGRLAEYEDSAVIQGIKRKVEEADYIVAPIADNKMYSIIGNFIDGEITDEQCRHCLSATDLGFQFIFKTEKALHQLKMLAKCYLSSDEKTDYLSSREESVRDGNDKVKAARIKYAGCGKYIDSLLRRNGHEENGYNRN